MLWSNHLSSNFSVSGEDTPLTEWEHLPPIGPRPYKGYVGLKNAGATCYMNSVIQQVGIRHYGNFLMRLTL